MGSLTLTEEKGEKMESVKIGIVSISDRASAGFYKDEGIPELESWLKRAIHNNIQFSQKLIADEISVIQETLKNLTDEVGCDLVLTTGGTGPSPRDVTPEATESIAHKVMPGFGEQMRQISLNFVPTAILSRQIAVIRGRTLIINLPGQPKSIKQTLEGLNNEENENMVPGIFASVPYCIDLIGGPYLFTRDEICKVFRPKKAIREFPK